MTQRPSIPGEPVRARYTKWDGSPHWQFDAVYLGTDEHGIWVGYPAGTRFARPGLGYRARTRGVGYFPDAGWTPAFYPGDQDHPYGTRVYTDLTTVPEWRGVPAGRRRNGARAFEVTMVDLDLDVIGFHAGHLDPRGRAFVDDRDEFAEHRVRYGYPDELVARVEADAQTLLAAVLDGEAPFDDVVPERWFAVLDTVLAGSAR
ncbi:DUF402 domain-containing protein [Myceligenerans pegani]|uniref:YgaC family protein n=1 Tax=Myceligenerans pegani TaxID=2776917 RepID=A0ABR9N0E9_9MICO|nr:DUF402 domain-containing protein [Myceligenerans sp. TRM 65318]MBE1877112.1 YgaC family protein [Myceligenerans sp. TRM 65318]MBE3019383.1 YgaC family protein [Myceligenerans sp. TRM 65318]